MASELISKLEIMNPYPRFKLSSEDVTRLRKFRQSVSKRLKTKFYDLPDDWRTNKEITTRWLFKDHSDNFDLWWKPDLIHIPNYAHEFSRLPDKFFDDWWDTDKWNWSNHCSLLSENYGELFDKWWDANKWNWDHRSRSLAAHLNDRFDDWWDIDKYNYSWFGALAEYCPQHFDTWWVINKITPQYYSDNCTELVLYCSDRFETWWRKNLFNYTWQSKNGLLENCGTWFHIWWSDDKWDENFWRDNSCYMASKYPDRFVIWWNKKKFNYAENNCALRGYQKPCGRHFLIEFCHEHFDVWWDKQRIRPDAYNYQLIEKFCGDHKIKWAAEMIIFELGKDIKGKPE